MSEQEIENLGVLWSPEQTAKYLGLSRITIYKWIKNGKIQAHKLGGKTVRIPRSEIEKIVNEKQNNLKTNIN